jgi:hypothetical protein
MSKLFVESYDIYDSIRNAEKYCDNIYDSFEKTVNEAQDKTFKEYIEACKKIQSKCEEDVNFSKRTVTITNPLLALDALKRLPDLGKTVETYITGNITKHEDFVKKEKDIMKAIDKLDNLVDEVFAQKDSSDMVFMVNGFLKLLEPMESTFSEKKEGKPGNFFNVVNTCSDALVIEENLVISYLKLNDTSGLDSEDREELIVRKKHIVSSKSVLSKFYNLELKMLGKTFGEVKGHVNSLIKNID